MLYAYMRACVRACVCVSYYVTLCHCNLRLAGKVCVTTMAKPSKDLGFTGWSWLVMAGQRHVESCCHSGRPPWPSLGEDRSTVA